MLNQEKRLFFIKVEKNTLSPTKDIFFNLLVIFTLLFLLLLTYFNQSEKSSQITVNELINELNKL